MFCCCHAGVFITIKEWSDFGRAVFLFSCPPTRRITILSRCQNGRLCLRISELMEKRHNTASLWRFNRDRNDMLWERDWSFQTSRWERGALSGPVEAFIRGRVTCIIKLESSIKLKCNFRRHLADRSSLPLNPSQRATSITFHRVHDDRRLKNSCCRSSPTFLWICFTSVSSFSPFSLSPSPFPSPSPLPTSRPRCPPPPRSSSQASNGQSSGYAYSLPSTPVVGHRDLRVAQGEGVSSVNSRSLKNIPRRPSLFKVSRCLTPFSLLSSLTTISIHSAPSLTLPPSCSNLPALFNHFHCCWICFRTGTQIRSLAMGKETRAARGEFPSNRFG